jgi:hypothetical protein
MQAWPNLALVRRESRLIVSPPVCTATDGSQSSIAFFFSFFFLRHCCYEFPISVVPNNFAWDLRAVCALHCHGLKTLVLDRFQTRL